MEKVCEPANLNQAYKRVKSNKGAAGIDGATVDELFDWIRSNKEPLIKSLMDGSYQPKPVREVMIPKPGGGVRQLGIPTVLDRLIQQAILQVLTPLLDPQFSQSSFGFRPGRSAHQALHQGAGYVREGYAIVVDMDLEKFFDRVNHDILMSRLARHVKDKRLLRIIRRYLSAGIMKQGLVTERVEGTPQGGPLSPLLSNLLLDDLDKELERRGHRFARYADDCNIYVRSEAAGKRVMSSITRFLEKKLRLKVNASKSAVAPVWERKFLGHRLLSGGKLGIAPESLSRMQYQVRVLTRRSRGRSLEIVVKQLNEYLTGWVTYYRYAAVKTYLVKLDEWIRRKLRCYRLKQRKKNRSIANWLIELGVPKERAWTTAKSPKGWWCLSKTPAVHEAMNQEWFKALGIVNLTQRYLTLQTFTKTAGCDNASPVV
jgi:RNA-directed DNA polymerase